jgi:hypothetical protein
MWEKAEKSNEKLAFTHMAEFFLRTGHSRKMAGKKTTNRPAR